MPYLQAFIAATWTTLADMAPYLLFGFLVAGLLSAVIRPEFVERHLGGRGFRPVLKAALAGVPLPLCSCGVIPVAASLRQHGASRGATTAFLLSTPQTGVDSILATYSLMGILFAVFRPVTAFITGLVGGALVDKLAEPHREALPVDPVATGLIVKTGQAPAACPDACCSPDKHGNRWLTALHYGLVTLPRDIANALLVGIVIAGLIAAFVPPDFFAPYIGTGFGGRLAGMLIMMTLGIPLYVCATGSIPVAAALMMKGFSPGAALVFLMTGPATNAATIAVIWKTMGRRTTLLYLLTLAACALTFGFTLDYLFTVPAMNHAAHAGHTMTPGWFNHAGAGALLALLAWSYAEPRFRRTQATETAPTCSLTLSVSGMHCSRCADSVVRALRECPDVKTATVNLKTGQAVVYGSTTDTAALIAAVEALGYAAQPANSENVQR